MFSIMNILRITLAKLLTFLYSFLSVFGAGIAISPELPETPDDFSPVLRFVICSDIHLNGEDDQEEAKRFAKMFDTAYEYSASQEHNTLDAFIVAGDMTNHGLPEEYRVFKNVINEKLRDETQFMVCMGNHEFIAYRDVDASEGTKVFEKEMQMNDDNSYTVNGYNFIICSYDENGKTFNAKKSWLNDELKKAKAQSGNKPIFVVQHPAPFASVYGSINWGDITIPTILSRYPQVIDFSGHSHYPVNDPRSLWQGGFTALGCGTLSYFETELDGIAGNFPYNNDQAAQFYIVEADDKGNVLIRAYDLITGQWFDLEYYLTDLAKRHYAYSYLRMKTIDKDPAFENPEISANKDDEGNTILSFNGAKDKFITESYKLSVTKNGLKVFEDNFSSKYMYLFEDDKYDINLGKLEKGKYHVQIVAMNAYAELSSPLNYTFTIE